MGQSEGIYINLNIYSLSEDINAFPESTADPLLSFQAKATPSSDTKIRMSTKTWADSFKL